MEKDIVTGRKIWIQNIINIFPKSLRLRFNPRRYEIENFVYSVAKNLPKNTKMLDAGAGPCPYKYLFSHCKYESTDFEDPNKILDFTCSLDKIPKNNNTYEAILFTEVLEHVEYPQKVIDELYRVLKKNGKLFLTCPQGWMLHQEPFNFYYFTKYGLESLMKNAKFREVKIIKMGGYFKFLGDILRFNSVSDNFKKYKIIYYPLCFLDLIIFKVISSFILFHLDFIDKNKLWTMGYTLEATK